MSTTLANIGYNAIAKVMTMAVTMVTSAILARNLSASDFGVVGIAMSVIGLFQRFSDIGINSSLIQRRALDKKVLETAQTLNLILVGALFLCALIFGPFTGSAFKSPAVPRVISVLAFGLLISTFGFLPSALLAREMKFAKLRVPSVGGTLVRGLVAVGCALAGWSYWSLVAGNLAGSFAMAVLLRIVRPVKAKLRVYRDNAKQLLLFGLPLWGSGLLVFAVFNLDNFVIGSVIGTTMLGYYTVAMTWSTFISGTLYETVHSVLFPRFSQIQLDRAYLTELYYRSLRVIMFISVMANAALFSVAGGFLVTILGKGTPRWLPSLGPLQILCVYGALRASIEPVGPVIMALGRTKLFLWANLIPALIEICFLPWIALKWGLRGVAGLVCVAYGLQWIVYGPFLKRELGMGPSKLLKLAIPVSLAAISGVLVSRTIQLNDPLSWGSILLRSGVVCVVFSIVHEVLTRGAFLAEIKIVAKAYMRGTHTPESN
jgi:O-antigen/teichoic acid export membrane protein